MTLYCIGDGVICIFFPLNPSYAICVRIAMGVTGI
jgi:hypothetical protein